MHALRTQRYRSTPHRTRSANCSDRGRRAEHLGPATPGGRMLRIARSRRALSGMALAVLLTASIVTPAVAGDEVIVQSGDTLWDLARATWHDGRFAGGPEPDPESVRHPHRAADRAATAGRDLGAAAGAARPVASGHLRRPVRRHAVGHRPATWHDGGRPGRAQSARQSLVHPHRSGAGHSPGRGRRHHPPPPRLRHPLRRRLHRASVHTVQAGETLWVISGRYGVSIQAIVDANRSPAPRSSAPASSW